MTGQKGSQAGTQIGRQAGQRGREEGRVGGIKGEGTHSDAEEFRQVAMEKIPCRGRDVRIEWDDDAIILTFPLSILGAKNPRGLGGGQDKGRGWEFVLEEVGGLLREELGDYRRDRMFLGCPSLELYSCVFLLPL